MPFTNTDRALLHRAARHLADEALVVKNSHSPWADAEGREQKRRYDRLLRDERDLRELARRLGGEPQPALLQVPAGSRVSERRFNALDRRRVNLQADHDPGFLERRVEALDRRRGP